MVYKAVATSGKNKRFYTLTCVLQLSMFGYHHNVLYYPLESNTLHLSKEK